MKQGQRKSLMESSIGVKVLTTVLVCLGCLPAAAQQNRIDLPDMGASADSVLSRAEEEEYAKALIRQMRAYDVLVDDPLIANFFEDMGFRLASHSDRPDKSFTFVVMNQDVVNAFAAPGGVIALYSGLILAADDENEVAGVVAHEIAHVTQQHLYRALEQQKAMTIPMILGMLAIAVAGGGDGQAIAGAVMTGQAAAAQAAINYTRQNEYEADRIGISTLSRAGYDPAGMGEFFEKMARITRAMGEGPSEFLRTHPVSVSRIAEAENRAASMPTPETGEGREFYLAQARLRQGAQEGLPEEPLRIQDLREPQVDTRVRARPGASLTGPDGVHHAVEVIMYDTESNPDTASSVASRLITEDQVDVLVCGTLIALLCGVARDAFSPRVHASRGSIHAPRPQAAGERGASTAAKRSRPLRPPRGALRPRAHPVGFVVVDEHFLLRIPLQLPFQPHGNVACVANAGGAVPDLDRLDPGRHVHLDRPHPFDQSADAGFR